MTRFPQYIKDLVYIFPKDNVTIDFANVLAKANGCEIVGEEAGMLLKGSLEDAKKLNDKYPEFFQGVDRIDLNSNNLYDTCEKIEMEIGGFRDKHSGVLGLIDKGEYNSELNNIIEELKKMRIE